MKTPDKSELIVLCGCGGGFGGQGGWLPSRKAGKIMGQLFRGAGIAGEGGGLPVRDGCDAMCAVAPSNLAQVTGKRGKSHRELSGFGKMVRVESGTVCAVVLSIPTQATGKAWQAPRRSSLNPLPRYFPVSPHCVNDLTVTQCCCVTAVALVRFVRLERLACGA